MLVTDDDDIRKMPLAMRKTNLARLLAPRVDGIFISDFERGEIGPELFRHACLMGLEGLLSKLVDRPYRPGLKLRARHGTSGMTMRVWGRSPKQRG
jgi:bifunctional non-homologous end joining protein LigD